LVRQGRHLARRQRLWIRTRTPGACPGIGMARVSSAAGPDARRRDEVRCVSTVEERQRQRRPRAAETLRAPGGLRAYAASLVVDDAPASLSSSLLASASQAPGARAIPIPGQAPRTPS